MKLIKTRLTDAEKFKLNLFLVENKEIVEAFTIPSLKAYVNDSLGFDISEDVIKASLKVVGVECFKKPKALSVEERLAKIEKSQEVMASYVIQLMRGIDDDI
jgi:hypothetical protein